jgi:2-iminoacetate synthase
MSFFETIEQYRDFDFAGAIGRAGEADVARALIAERPAAADFLAMLSPAAEGRLEDMARRSQETTLRHFGRVIQLYAPLYISNYCVNECAYCGFRQGTHIPRMKLTMEEIEREGRSLAATGIRHVLVLTGESRKESPVSYIREGIELLRKYFSSVSAEVYPVDEREYADLVSSGLDGLTIYQETYDELVYDALHRGPKRDYRWRLDAPERACRARVRTVGVGALLGLADWRRDAFLTGLHAAYLQDRFPEVEVSVSLPRLQPQEGHYTSPHEVGDRELVQIMCAFRLFIPRAGITVSTRERGYMRDNLVGLGVTRMSAGSHTEVGGYAQGPKTTGQFEIADHRSVEEVSAMIYARGYQPVFKDWQNL